MTPRVKTIILEYKKNNIKGVYDYLSQSKMVVDSSTWSGHIKKSIEDGLVTSVSLEIELLIEKFNFYKND